MNQVEQICATDAELRYLTEEERGFSEGTKGLLIALRQLGESQSNMGKVLNDVSKGVCNE